MNLSSMPTGAKVAAGGAGVASLSLLMYRILPPQLLYYVMIGTLVVGVLLGAFGWLVARLRQRKAKPMERSLRDNSAATPQGVTDVARRARLDDIRRNFETGVEKFKAAGKNLYSLPWYVLVGEPGSGKTEAVRHCNVGFPPGLQDQLQGVGGTINMNWWFTNHAIILDTAGRLMFEEVEPGATSEWREFLKLLRINRPNCPINGMLLCIPSDSLIKDTADQLERKGAKIAQQLDQIQRALGVRFPVFVMVTKCDLINGFREFFEDITDPQLQHQMIGWSNPAPLDEPFNPELVSDHLRTVAARLVRRRLGLLLDPVNTEDTSARRTGQVDALYAFPQSVMAIAPRLRRYLEMIFVAGEWSAKPLFLRGIYFTSSMREGSALDSELAEVLGVPVESLPEGKVWERDRAYFLRDLFMNKVFREKGLVTNATNAKKRQRRRKTAVLVAALLAVLALSVFTWWGFTRFRGSIGTEADYWLAAAKDGYWAAAPYWVPVVSPKFTGSTEFNYEKSTQIEMPGGEVKLGRFHGETMRLVHRPIEVPWVFRFAATFGSDINANRRKAQRVLFEAGVLRPVVEAARRKMAKAVPKDTQPATTWSPLATTVLGELARLENQTVQGGGGPPLDANSLLQYVLSNPEDYKHYRQNDAANFGAISAWTYGEAGQPWPPRSLGATTREAAEAVDRGLAEFIQYWKMGGGVEAGEVLEAIAALRRALGRFGDAEAELIALDDRYAAQPAQPDTLELLTKLEGEWRSRLGAVAAEGKNIDAAMATARLGNRTLVETYDTTIAERLKRAETPHKMLLSAAQPAKRPAGEKLPEIDKTTATWQQHLKGIAAKVLASLEGLEAEYKKSQERQELLVLDPRFLQLVGIKDADLRGRLKKESLRLFELRMRMYQMADGELAKQDATPKVAGLAPAVTGVLEDTQGALRGIDDLAALQVEGFRVADGAGVSKFAADRLAKRKRIHSLLKGVLDSAPKTAEDVAAEVTKAVQERGLPTSRPAIPGTNFKKDQSFPDKYHPKAATATFAGWKTIAQYVAPEPAPGSAATAGAASDLIDRKELAALYQARQDAYSAYLAQYQTYWIKDVLADLSYNSPNWKSFQADLIGMQLRTITMDLEGLGKTILASLREVEQVVPTAAKPKYDEAVGRLTKGLGRFGTATYMGFWEGWLRRWKDLGPDADAARKAILPKTPTQCIDDYIPFSPEADTDISESYWKQLAYAGLELLAKETDVNVEAAYQDLRKFARFPLAAPRAGEKELGADEAPAARAALDKVFGAAQVYDAKTIGGGARTERYATVDEQLNRLCGLGLEKSKRTWCEKVKAVLAALPEAKEPLACAVSVLPVAKQEEYATGGESAVKIWAVLQIDQGAVRKGIRNTNQTEAKEVGKLDLPGDEVVLKLYRYPDDVQQNKVDRTHSVVGAWGALKLLHTPSAKRVAEDGTKWHVELVVQDSENRKRSLWLELQFPKAVPRIDQWP